MLSSISFPRRCGAVAISVQRHHRPATRTNSPAANNAASSNECCRDCGANNRPNRTNRYRARANSGCIGTNGEQLRADQRGIEPGSCSATANNGGSTASKERALPVPGADASGLLDTGQ